MPSKKAYEITESGVVLDGPGLYYGFTVEAGGTSRRFEAWDNPTTNAGTRVENYTTDTEKGKNMHEEPVYLESGLYVGVNGGQAIVYAWRNPLQG